MGKKYNTDLMSRNGIMSALPLNPKPEIRPGRNIPDDMIVDINDPGVFLGLERKFGKGYYVGKPSDVDGNVLTLGINGSGKSRYLVKSTLETWQYPLVVLDIKGELASHYDYLRRKGIVNRKHIVFDPTKGGISYDVYASFDKDDPHFVQYVKEAAYAIIPMPLNVRDPYWINMARDFLSGAIVYYFNRGHNFINTMLLMQQSSVANLCKEIMASDCTLAKMFIGEVSALKAEQKAAIGTDVKQHTMVFATDPDIQDALSPSEDGYATFSWKDIVMNPGAPNVFLCLDQSRLEQWSGVIRLMVTQLIRQIERRPDKHRDGESETVPLLLLLDEFPLLGRMDAITSAMTTLRSKKATLYLVIQSIAQLDAVYGSDTRKILIDNCQYKAILNVTEPDTQKYLSEMLGTVSTERIGVSQSLDPYMERLGWGTHVQEDREPLILPHEFTTNRDIWLHTPYGFLSTIKLPAIVTRKPVYQFEEYISAYFRRDQE